VANRGMLCLAIGAAMLATACAVSHTGHPHFRPELPAADNIHIAFPLEPCVGTMLSRSNTFRRTYFAIANRRDIRVSLALDSRRSSRTRAETEIHSFAGGDRVADIRLHSTNDVVELIAHEMEHVREQLEGTNLLLLSVARTMDVQRVGIRYETRRGIETGLQVAEEVGSSAERMCHASIKNAALMTRVF
jgi:hypothetical protein